MERQKDEQTLSELSSPIVTMMTTEHYNLQSGLDYFNAINGCIGGVWGRSWQSSFQANRSKRSWKREKEGART
jgi:hypothetical protein